MLARRILPTGLVRTPFSITKALFSTAQQLDIVIPSNLHLAKPDVIYDKPKVKTMFSPETYFFPPLSVPKSIEVSSFSSPKEPLEQKVDIDSRIFGVAIRKDIVHEVVRYQRHKLRQPKKTKRMSEISGSNKKPRPQKGGGQSQAGHKRNSVWRGGQKAHGPVLRDYSISLNRKYRAMGIMIVLAAKLQEGNLIIFDEITCKVIYSLIHKTYYI